MIQNKCFLLRLTLLLSLLIGLTACTTPVAVSPLEDPDDTATFSGALFRGPLNGSPERLFPTVIRVMDAEGYIRFVGRDDDVITSSGYRIGPTEIEDCLLRHPAVSLAAVVGKPDPVRTEIVKAFIVPRDGIHPDEALAEDIREFVRKRLSAHEYPREIAFRESLPLTTTGKVIRRILRQEV